MEMFKVHEKILVVRIFNRMHRIVTYQGVHAVADVYLFVLHEGSRRVVGEGSHTRISKL